MSSQHPDFKWIEQLHFGNEEAYRILFDEYYQMLGVFAMKYVKDKEVAEDIVQDVITELYSPRCPQIVPVSVRKKQGPQFPAPSAGTRTLLEQQDGRRKFFSEQYHPRRGILSPAENDWGTLRSGTANL